MIENTRKIAVKARFITNINATLSKKTPALAQNLTDAVRHAAQIVTMRRYLTARGGIDPAGASPY
jgi:hypothetical protein